MVDDKHPTLSLTRQCKLLTLNRSTLYYKPVAVAEINIDLMNHIRALLLQSRYIRHFQ